MTLKKIKETNVTATSDSNYKCYIIVYREVADNETVIPSTSKYHFKFYLRSESAITRRQHTWGVYYNLYDKNGKTFNSYAASNKQFSFPKSEALNADGALAMKAKTGYVLYEFSATLNNDGSTYTISMRAVCNATTPRYCPALDTSGNAARLKLSFSTAQHAITPAQVTGLTYTGDPVLNNVQIKWNKAGNAVSYEVHRRTFVLNELSYTEGKTNEYIYNTTATSSDSSFSSLTAGCLSCYRVRARSSTGHYGAWSSWLYVYKHGTPRVVNDNGVIVDAVPWIKLDGQWMRCAAYAKDENGNWKIALSRCDT